MRYCESPYFYQRRKTREVVIGDPKNGGVIIGGDHPVVKQSMLTCDTMDTALSVKQTLELVEVGCQLVRITAPTVKDAANLKNIVEELRKRGCTVPIVADIHFKPEAAMEAAKWVEVVRVNPGNYADSKKFAIKEYTDAQYLEELKRIEEKFTPLVLECKKLKRALRIGTNHGSLSDRIMNRFGDSPLGMVESALEFAHIARKHNFHNFKFSMKSSNPKVMIECYRLLVARLEQEGPDWNYPIHLGVTEAGEGEDGRIKSAIGIGSLLCDGLGDTIRVSLTEDSPREIEVCRDLLAQIPFLTVAADVRRLTSKSELDQSLLTSAATWAFDPFHFERRNTPEIELSEHFKCGGEQTVRVVVTRATWDKVAPKIRPKDDVKPEAVYEDLNIAEIDPIQDFDINCDTQLVTVKDGVKLPAITAFRLLAAKLKRLGRNNPILLKDCINFDGSRRGNEADTSNVGNPPPHVVGYEILEPKIALLRASVVIGALLADGIGDAILVRGESGGGQSLRLAYNILQAAGCRSFKTDYVACPSCGRTLFNLQTVTARIKTRTEHLKGVKIAIMGCIVNGPGEMADADFGYVGGAPSKINLYVGKTPIKFNIPEADAVERLVDLIKEHNKWVEPTLNQAQQDELLKFDIPLMLDNFSLASLLAGFLITYGTANLPPPSATVFLRGKGPPADIPGENCGFFVTPVIQMAILDCRRSLEFFGLTCDDKTNRLKQIVSRSYTDDLGIENFGLSQVKPEDFLRVTAPAITGQVESMLVEVHRFSNKQLAHFTIRQNQVMLPSIRDISPVMTKAFNHFLFDALERPRPRIQPSDF